MLIYDEDLDEMVEDYRKWYECPKCNMDWTNDDCEDDDFEEWPKDEDLKGVTVLNINDGKEIEYRKYVEKLCPDCGGIIIDGRLKGPRIEVAPVKEEDFKCQVCGSKHLDSKPYVGNRMQIYLYVCSWCNSYNYVDSDGYNGWDPVDVTYREDLTTRQWNESFPECLDILRSKGMLIKKED